MQKILLGFVLTLLCPCFIWAACNYTSDGSYSDTNTKIGLASSGQTVCVPSGNYTWSATNNVVVDKTITLEGAGAGVTNITFSSVDWGDSALSVSGANVTIKGFTFKLPAASGFGVVFSGSNFRITACEFTASGASHNVNAVHANGVYGVIDNNTFNKGAGDAELVYIYGPDNSWTTDHSMGGANNVFVENNTYNDEGYVIDCNRNGRCVVRYNTITGPVKIDGHGIASNPPHGVRHIEAYNNNWTNTDTDWWSSFELRGGTGRIYDNVVANTNTWLLLKEYCFVSGPVWEGCDVGCLCPGEYPGADQLGFGKNQTSEPYYLWNNKKNGTNYTIDIGEQEAACVSACGSVSQETVVQSGRDYFNSASKPEAMSGYTMYACPHPSVGSGSCTSTAGTSGYTVTGETPAITSVTGLTISGGVSIQ